MESEEKTEMAQKREIMKVRQCEGEQKERKGTTDRERGRGTGTGRGGETKRCLWIAVLQIGCFIYFPCAS